MPKGQQKQGHKNQPKLTVKEKAAKKAAKRAKAQESGLPAPQKRK